MNKKEREYLNNLRKELSEYLNSYGLRRFFNVLHIKDLNLNQIIRLEYNKYEKPLDFYSCHFEHFKKHKIDKVINKKIFLRCPYPFGVCVSGRVKKFNKKKLFTRFLKKENNYLSFFAENLFGEGLKINRKIGLIVFFIEPRISLCRGKFINYRIHEQIAILINKTDLCKLLPKKNIFELIDI